MPGNFQGGGGAPGNEIWPSITRQHRKSGSAPHSSEGLLRHDVDKVLREEQCGFRKGRGCVDRVFTLRLITEKSLRCQTPLVLSFIDYVKAFDSVDRRTLTKVLSLYGIPEKYIRVICAMYKNNTAAVKGVINYHGVILFLEKARPLSIITEVEGTLRCDAAYSQ
ncbi:uncharacterized protein LOC136041688 [Artemia franciscana]|uniref:uncharacterized protein LOC136041688 n=1 Tax=Artemia franciscana TaxID=6661 RepID=UPI0032DB81AD